MKMIYGVTFFLKVLMRFILFPGLSRSASHPRILLESSPYKDEGPRRSDSNGIDLQGVHRRSAVPVERRDRRSEINIKGQTRSSVKRQRRHEVNLPVFIQ